MNQEHGPAMGGVDLQDGARWFICGLLSTLAPWIDGWCRFSPHWFIRRRLVAHLVLDVVCWLGGLGGSIGFFGYIMGSGLGW